MWPFKKKKNNKKTTFDFSELNQTDFSPHNFMHFSIGDEPQQNNTTFGSGDFGGAGASGSWGNDSSDSSNDFGGDSESGDSGGGD